MCNDVNEQEWPSLARDVHIRMATYVQPYLASISKTNDNTNGQAHGSGVYLGLREEIGLLSCDHVVSNASATGYRIAHLLKRGDFYQAFKNPWVTDSFPVDLALTFIDSGVWSQGDRIALPLTGISRAHDVAAGELLMLCGYPGGPSYFSRFSGTPTLYSPTLPYTARETDLPSGFDAGTHFALKYEMELSESVDGTTDGLPEPGGFSGSPIWDSGFVASKCSKDWAPARARIVGIANTWIQEDSCIIATKAEKVREFLIAQVRYRVALDRWLKRGNKSADFQIDLDHAAQLVPDLS